MTMTPYNGDIKQSLKWMQNNAPNIQKLVFSKSDWYQQYHTKFWTDWEANIFDLRTCNTFGLMIWCIILNVPADLFGLFPLNLSFAFGNQRQNFTAVGDPHAPVTDPNVPGGNFYGGGNSTILDLTEVRWALQLRYVALVSDGRLSFINEMLNFIFGDAQPWDFPNKKYFYVADSTLPAGSATVTGMWINDWEGNTPVFATPRTNLLLRSNTIGGTGWVGGGAGYGGTFASSTTVAAPDGTATAVARVTIANAAQLIARQTGVSAPAGPTVVSLFVYVPSGQSGVTGIRLVPDWNDTENGAAASTTLTNQWVRLTSKATLAATRTQLDLNFSLPNGTSLPTGTIFYLAFSQAESGNVAGQYIPTTTAVVARTDYTLNSTTGAVTFALAPVTGATLTWTGGYNQAFVTTPYQFGTGNGSTTVFTLKAPGSVAPISQASYMEYRIGANMGISSQFVSLMNSQQYGITPSCAGVKYLVVQES